ncbi:MAG: hypothetical protein GF334_08080 [Candidatus Altiarchaeales archaeon]|nr:hypothetical protein [Candidatus Altiarchaeales archaeon]
MTKYQKYHVTVMVLNAAIIGVLNNPIAIGIAFLVIALQIALLHITDA